MISLAIVTGALYIIIIGLFYIGWLKTSTFQSKIDKPPIKVSVIIAFRNEEHNLPTLVHCIKNQNYPAELIEIIAINDHSTDKSLEIAHKLDIHKLFSLSQHKSGKKAALLEGTNFADGELIITTDADCIPGPNWIPTLVSFFLHNKPALIVAPVMIQHNNTLFSKYQQFEFSSLQGSAAGAIAINKPIMCNGANLAFPRKSIPIIQQSYKEYQSQSGDDIFALLALHKTYPGEIFFIKSAQAVVYTKPANSINEFLAQRKRWASKARYYSNFFLITTACIVLVTNLLLSVFLAYGFLWGLWAPFLLLIILKSIIDIPFLSAISKFFNTTKLLFWFPVFQGFYFLYISFTFVMSLTGGYTWKSRKIKS